MDEVPALLHLVVIDGAAEFHVLDRHLSVGLFPPTRLGSMNGLGQLLEHAEENVQGGDPMTTYGHSSFMLVK